MKKYLTLLLLILNLIYITPVQARSIPSPGYWKAVSTLGIGENFLHSATSDGESLYLVGDDLITETSSGQEILNSNEYSILQKRDKRTGFLVSDFGDNGVIHIDFKGILPIGTGINALTVDDTYLYLFGSGISAGLVAPNTYMYINSHWRIEKRDKKTGELIPDFGDHGVIMVDGKNDDFSQATDLKVDDQSLYLASRANGNLAGKIQKRDLQSGKVIWELKTSAVDPRLHLDQNFIYLLGLADFKDIQRSNMGSPLLLEKREKATGKLVWSVPYRKYFLWNPVLTGDEHALYLGLTGGDYQGQIEKLDKATGKLIWKSLISKKLAIDDIEVNDEFIYATGDDLTAALEVSLKWMVEKKDKNTGQKIWIKNQPLKSFPRKKRNPSANLRAMEIDTQGIYLMGDVYWEAGAPVIGAPDNRRVNWEIQKIRK